MKIRVRKTENCIVINVQVMIKDKAETFRFYLTVKELERILTEKYGLFDDCGNIMQVRGDLLAFVYSPGNMRHEFGEIGYVYVRMNTEHFFTRVEQLLAKGIITEHGIGLDSASFPLAEPEKPELNWSQIYKAAQFNARTAVANALKRGSASAIMELKGIIERLIRQGKTICNDFADCNFYFFQTEGKGYNGGIIYHEHYGRWSVHT